jgi:hypothetical protein
LLLCLLVVLPLFPGRAGAASWKDPGITKNEVEHYRVLKDGANTGEHQQMRIEVRDSDYLVTFTLEGREGVSEFVTEFTRGDSFRAARCFRRKSDPAGRTILRGDIRISDIPRYRENTCPLFGNYFAFRSLAMEGKEQKLSYPCLYPGGSSFVLTLKVGPVEEIRTPAETYRCVRMEETLDMKSLRGGLFGSLLSILAIPIVPKTTYWFDSRFPHVLVKREGVAGPPPNDYIVISELIDHEKGNPD